MSTTRRGPRARGLWQSIVRVVRYRLVIPVFRSPHPPAYTARGVANGVFWGFTPTLGLQTTEIVVTWFLARTLLRRDSSLLQALIWVWVNNPLTMLPMFYVFYVTGGWFTGSSSGGYDAFVALWDAQADSGWLARARNLATAIGTPMLIGCVPYAVAASLLSYRWALTAARRRRNRLLAKKSADL